MSVEDLIAKVSGRCDSKLLKTTRMENLSPKRQEFLSKLYDEQALNSRLMGTLLNGVYTEQKTTFLMSLPLMRSLIEVDFVNGNLKRNTLNDREYKAFVVALRKNEIIEVLSESETKSNKHPNGFAGTWQLVDRDALQIVNIELDEFDEEGYPWDYVEQMQATTDTYFESGLYNNVTSINKESETTSSKDNLPLIQEPIKRKKNYNFD